MVCIHIQFFLSFYAHNLNYLRGQQSDYNEHGALWLVYARMILVFKKKCFMSRQYLQKSIALEIAPSHFL